MNAILPPPPPEAAAPRALSVETVSITKRFGSFTALDAVSIRIRPGTVHALLGENGAGKSTLVKCIMGYYRPDEGSVVVEDREREIGNPRDAHALGLGMVYQHFTLVPSMTVLENLVMARADVPAIIDWAAERRVMEEFLSRMPFGVPLDRPVALLAAGEKQKAEILKQLYLDSRFLILDEPTSVLTPGEADEILGLIRKMAAAGDITVLIITHKFREVTAFADDVSVLRRGKLVGGGSVADLGIDDLAQLMIGAKEVAGSVSRLAAPADAHTRLELKGICAEDDSGTDALREVSFAVKAGEIVGIAGVSGNGQIQLVEVLAGQRKASAGEVLVHGEKFGATREETRRHRMALLPEEPLRNASVARMSVAENMAFRRFDTPPFSSRRGGWLSRKAIREAALALIERYNVKTQGPDAAIGTLSGGNVQRAILGRELGEAVDILVVANPVFGLDFAAVAEIHGQIMAARNRGAAVLLVSEDLDELLELSDRLLVMSDGAIALEVPTAGADRVAIGRAMAGH
ncbi:ABC transporter ATP-binding protein [Radicibacter daui]|uniref:ABC transporter ATP-binding protein n=1 Tax=Radicibacter daui TaxID=3064829 RepID=UPI0040469633